MDRRRFQLQIAAAIATTAAWPRAGAADGAVVPQSAWQAIERSVGGRLGVAVLTAGGTVEGHRLDERFPLCSTFKWLAAALVLHRVDSGQEQLERRIRFGPEALRSHSPVSAGHVGGDGMTLGELCHATITVSDNAAGNLILATFGGPAGLTRYARSLGDPSTRLDRWETELNEATPGDRRDTTTPRAMAGLLQAVVIGQALSPSSRDRLVGWLEASETNGERLRAGLPAGWRLGSKTGTGAHGSTNDVGVFWPPGRAPTVVAVYLTGSGAKQDALNGAVAAAARQARATM